MSDLGKTDHVFLSDGVKKRGRPRKTQPVEAETSPRKETSQAMVCRYFGPVRTYFFKYWIDKTGGELKVTGLKVSTKTKDLPIKSVIGKVGENRIKAVIRRHLIKSKLARPRQSVIFDPSCFLE